jgi:hypothetical protein
LTSGEADESRTLRNFSKTARKLGRQTRRAAERRDFAIAIVRRGARFCDDSVTEMRSFDFISHGDRYGCGLDAENHPAQ